MADEAWDDRAPRGCRDPRLWQVAAELLAVHDSEGCVACQADGPCTVVSSALEAQSRAMEAFAVRLLRGDDYFTRRAVGRAKVRQCDRWARRLQQWAGQE